VSVHESPSGSVELFVELSIHQSSWSVRVQLNRLIGLIGLMGVIGLIGLIEFIGWNGAPLVFDLIVSSFFLYLSLTSFKKFYLAFLFVVVVAAVVVVVVAAVQHFNCLDGSGFHSALGFHRTRSLQLNSMQLTQLAQLAQFDWVYGVDFSRLTRIKLPSIERDWISLALADWPSPSTWIDSI